MSTELSPDLLWLSPASSLEPAHRAALDALPVCAWSSGADGAADFYNRAFLVYLGRDEEHAGGWAWLNTVHPDDRQSAVEEWDRALRAGDRYHADLRLRDHSTNEYRWCSCRAMPARDTHGVVVRWFGTATDIQDRVKNEHARRESDERYQVAVASMIDPLGVYEAVRDEIGRIIDFRVVYVNDAACEATRLARDEQVGRLLSHLFPTLLKIPLFDEYCMVVASGRPMHRRSVAHLGEGAGGSRAFDISASRLRDGFVAVWRDVTQDYEADERLQLALETGQIGVWEWELGSDRVRWSPEAIRLIGMESHSGQATLDDFLRRVHPEDKDRLWQAVEVALSDTGEFESEFRFLPDGGDVRWLVNRGRVMRDEMSRPVRMIGIAVDVSGRRRREDWEREQRDLLRTVIDAVPANVSYSTPDFHYVTVNKHYSERFGLQPEQCIGRHARDVVGEDAFATLEPYFRQALGKESVSVELAIPYGSRGQRYMSVHLLPHVDATGTVVGIVGVSWDLTDRRDLEESLRAADRQKDQMIGVISHEIRNCLGPINGGVGLWKPDVPTNVQGRARDIVQRQTAQLTRHVDDLLDLARIRQSTLTLNPARIDVRRPIQDAIEAMQPTFAARQQQLVLSFEDEALPVNGDRQRLVQVVTNLLSNAVRHTPPGGQIAVATRRTGDHVEIRVADTGPGLPPELRSRLFEPFVRGVQAGSVGLGLGLHIVREIVKLHGGSIRLEETAGAVFTIELPRWSD